MASKFRVQQKIRDLLFPVNIEILDMRLHETTYYASGNIAWKTFRNIFQRH